MAIFKEITENECFNESHTFVKSNNLTNTAWSLRHNVKSEAPPIASENLTNNRDNLMETVQYRR